MKKSLVILVSLGLIFLLSMSVVSASWFGDIWKKITGKTTENDTSSGCTDECSSNGAKQCSGSLTGYQTCGNYDADLCLEWSSATSCSSSETCVIGACVSNTYTCDDSDGGKDYNVKGRVTASSPTSSTDVTDLCSGSTGLVEYFCTNLQQSGETYTCPNGCSNGACISSSTTTTNTTNQTGCANGCAFAGQIVVCWLPGSLPGSQTCGNYDPDSCLEWNSCVSSTTPATNTTNTTTSTTPPVSVTNPAISITPTTTASAGASSGGRTTPIITESPEGIFEEKTITEEKFEGEIKITTESKKFTDRAGNKVEVEVKTEIKEDGTTITEERREFINKDGRLIKLKFIFENDGNEVKIKREIEVDGKKIESKLEILEKFEGEEVQLKARLSNGNEQEIKIMPDRASEIAIEKLKSKNFNVELKEVGEGENLKAIYIAKVDENGRLLGLFKVRLKSEAQIDSETGEIISLEKSWWNFLAIKLNEPIKFAGNQTCADDCSPNGAIVCWGSSGYQTCGNYDADSCLELNSGVISCPSPTGCVNGVCIILTNQTGNNTNNLTNITFPPPINITINNTNNLTNITLPPPINWSINYSCTDSDGGRNYSLKGNVIAKSPTSDINVTDLCSDSIKVVEYFCINSSQSGETHNCPNGCSNGACL